MPSGRDIRELPFESIYRHGYVRVAAAVPRVRIGDPAFNAERTIALVRQAHDQDAALVVFPELGLSAYTSEDLFRQDALLDATLDAIEHVRAATEQLAPVTIVGAPLRAEQGLFNAAVVIHRGRILGAVPKSYLPEYREFYEKRQFRAARDADQPAGRDQWRERSPSAPTCCSAPTTPKPHGPRRDLRGRLGGDPAEHLRRACRRDGAGQPLGQQHHGRQVRLSAQALCAAIRRAH